MTNETWKPIPAFEGRYEVSDIGRVRSLPRQVDCRDKKGVWRTRGVPGRVLKTGDCRGYRIVNLSPEGTVAVHLLVARAFLPGAGQDVNHKDGVKHNNALANLEWMSKSENQRHAVDAGLKSQAVRVRHPTTGQVFSSIAQASRAAKCRAKAVSSSWERV